ncbi:MAG: hypothetical protein INQ03_15555 [Candidatus Heimdallarchaeota archaeon]|nr:hypothetical protein [Candidatus Heimdallarchaeota archaeon]
MSNRLGQYFCNKCMRPVLKPGICDNCTIKEQRVLKAGNFCDHCRKNATQDLIYINRKTKKRYCVDCRAIFRMALIDKGMSVEDATKIMITDFVLVNDPTKKSKIRRK